MTGYFGPEHARKDWERQVPTPVGAPCVHCHEVIVEGDIGTLIPVVGVDRATIEPAHYECTMRQVLGSVGHVQGVCSCNIPGSTEGDPAGMSLREGALAAVREWERRQ